MANHVWTEIANLQCLTIACPPCLTTSLCEACAPYVVAVMNDGDVVPFLSFANGHRLLNQVRNLLATYTANTSEWYKPSGTSHAGKHEKWGLKTVMMNENRRLT